MDNQNNSVYSELSDQARKMDIALYYTAGDREKARQMVAGNYNDVYVIKVKFSSSTIYGVLMLFINNVKILNRGAILYFSNSYDVKNIDINLSWTLIEKELMEMMDKHGYDDILINSYIDKISNLLDTRQIKQIIDLVEKKDMVQLDVLLKKIISDSLNLQRVDVLSSVQSTSSLQIELNTQLLPKLQKEDLTLIQNNNKEELLNKGKKSDADEYKPEVGVDGVKLIIKSALILSPIKGKHISSLKPGDRIMVSIVDTNPQAKKVAEALNAIDENKIKPVPARITYVKKLSTGGYQIYGLIAKGIVVDIFEEEENIKVALDPAYALTLGIDDQEDEKTNYILIASLVLGFGALVGIIIWLIFS